MIVDQSACDVAMRAKLCPPDPGILRRPRTTFQQILTAAPPRPNIETTKSVSRTFNYQYKRYYFPSHHQSIKQLAYNRFCSVRRSSSSLTNLPPLITIQVAVITPDSDLKISVFRQPRFDSGQDLSFCFDYVLLLVKGLECLMDGLGVFQSCGGGGIFFYVSLASGVWES